MKAHAASLHVVVVVALVLAAACGKGDGGGPAGGPVARFALVEGQVPAMMDVPFPSDVYLKDGHVMDPVPGVDAIVPTNADRITHELGKLDGFSRAAFASFYVDDAAEAPPDVGDGVGYARLDPASLPRDEPDCAADTSSTFLVDLEERDPAKARVPCRAAIHDDTPFGSLERPTLAVGPARGILLQEGHRYAAVVTSRVTDRRGRHVAPSAAFADLAAGKRQGPFGAMYGAALDQAGAVLGPALIADHAKIVAIAPYTTNTKSRELFDARDTLDTLPVPALSWAAADVAPMGAARFAEKPAGGALPAGFTASLDDWLGVVDPSHRLPDGSDDPDTSLPVRAHDKIAALGTAVFASASFLVDAPGGATVVDNGTFARDASGRIVPNAAAPTAKIWVTFAVPTAPMPPGGYPAVILQHGMGESRTWMMGLANVMASQGWIAVAIDSITFGARAPEALYQVDSSTEYEHAPGATYHGPDGFADPVNGSTNGPSDFFGDLLNLGALRDHLRQAALDTVELVRVLRSDPDLSPLQTGATAPHVDPSRIAYVGNSLGSIEGTLATVVEPHLAASFLNVDSGLVVLEAGNHGAGIGLLLQAGAAIGFGVRNDHLSESHLLMNLVQTVIEPGDPFAYAPYLVARPGVVGGAPMTPRNLFVTEVIYDELLGNEGVEALARAAGLPLAVPNVGSNAGTRDVKHLTANVGRVPFQEAPPDPATGTIHDVPVAGVTAALVQVSPGEHGVDLVGSKCTRTSAIPFAKFDTGEPFTRLDKAIQVRCSYRELQAAMTRFLSDALAGKVPAIAGFKPPVRDYDDDGAPDDTDADPSNPAVQ